MTHSTFAGRTVTSVRNIERLLNTVDPNIHHGEAITCVWRAETAACRQARLAAGLPAGDGPEESECGSGCRNLAYTDRDITEQQARQRHWLTAATDPLMPKPLRDRAAALAAAAQAIIDRHQQTGATHSEMGVARFQ